MKNKKHRMTEEETVIQIPEVKDIPGQEKIRPPHISEMIDTTASSADEEGEGLLDDLNREDDFSPLTDIETDVTEPEKKLLDQSDRPVTEEAKDLQKLALDKADEEDLLNEEGDPLDMGKDLDVPGSELDDDNEELGEEDEENNSYSRRD